MKKTKNAMVKKYLNMMYQKIMRHKTTMNKQKNLIEPEKNYKMLGI